MKNSPALAIPLSLVALMSLFAGETTAQTLTADVSQLSVAQGGTQTFTLDAGVAHALDTYLLLGSVSGTTPGQPVDGQLLPLNYDSYFLHTLVHPNSPTLGNSWGLLSSDLPGPGGMATATFTLPPKLDPTLVGMTVHHAFVVLDWSTGMVSLTSNAVPVDLVVTPADALPPVGMSLIPAGTFIMGDHFDVGSVDEKPLHTVTLDAFYMDIFETTNESYAEYLNAAYAQGLIDVTGGAVWKAGDTEPYIEYGAAVSGYRINWDGTTFTVEAGKLDHPVNWVTWYGAVAFANWRSVQDYLTPCYDLSSWSCDFAANGYRLPTEAEWEYAARGGLQPTYYLYPWGNTLDGSMANYNGSGDPYEGGLHPLTTPVGYYDGSQTPSGVDMANGFGLYDTAGNINEWCNDWYSSTYYATSPSSNPQGPSSGQQRVFRGGDYGSDPALSPVPNYLRSAARAATTPLPWFGIRFGFRLARPSTE